MNKRKLKKWIVNLRTTIIYSLIGLAFLALLFYALIGAILQTSYRLNGVTQEEMELINE